MDSGILAYFKIVFKRFGKGKPAGFCYPIDVADLKRANFVQVVKQTLKLKLDSYFDYLH